MDKYKTMQVSWCCCYVDDEDDDMAKKWGSLKSRYSWETEKNGEKREKKLNKNIIKSK